eukprot:g5267.t1
MEPGVEASFPKADLPKTEEFESKRAGYFADQYRKSSLYWSSVCELMTNNAGSTNQVLAYMAARLETDRAYTSAVYANADKVFGDKKGAAKLRHDKIRHAEMKAKLEGKTASVTEDAMVAGGGGRDPGAVPQNGPVKAIWEMAEMDCRAARQRDVLCDELEHEDLLGAVKVMGKEMELRFKELSDEGNACLLSLANIDKRVGQAFIHLKETLGDQLGGKSLHEDVWFLDTNYRTAVVHQKEAWNAVTVKLREVFNKMKDLEAERRRVLREFMISANSAIGNSWSKLRALCGPAMDMANAVDPSRGSVDREVATLVEAGMEEKKRVDSKDHELVNTTSIVHANPTPSDASFIDGLTAPLESPLVRCMMMVERRHGKAIKNHTYYAGLMVLSWDGFIHFFDVPALKQDASPAAAFQEISPTISLADLLTNKKDLEEVLMFKSTHTLQLDDNSVVEAVSSQKSHKLEVKGKTQITSIKRHFGSGTTHKTVIFRTSTEAEMNHALAEIADTICARGGMKEAAATIRQSSGSRSSFGSLKSDSGSTKAPAAEPTAAAPVPAPSSTVPPAASAAPAPAAADPVKEPTPAAAAAAAPAAATAGTPAAGEGSSEAVTATDSAPTAAAASPAMTLDELRMLLAEEWDQLADDDKTPYRDKANERRLQHERETMGAAIALTQIGTPSFHPGAPATPVAPIEKARRCLEIGTPDWQSPGAPKSPYLGYDDASSGGEAGNGSVDRPWGLTEGITAPTNTLPPVVRRRGGAGRFTSPTVAAAAAAAAAAASVIGVIPDSRSAGDDGGGCGPDVGVGFEGRPAGGEAETAAAATAATNGGNGSMDAATANTARSGGGPKNATATTTSFSPRGRKRKPSSSASSSVSTKRSQSSSSAKKAPAAAAAAAAAAVKKNRSEERARKAEYRAGREIVAKMSKKDAARPKAPQSSYILFYTEKMASVKAARPHMNITDIGTAVGKAWRGLSDEERSPYTRQAEANRKRYQDQLCAIAREAAAASATAAAPAH